jgi:hypothetical protein
LRVDSKHKNQHVSKKIDTQTFENDTSACEIHMHESSFLNIFFLKHSQFSEQTSEHDFNTDECDLTIHSMIFPRTSVISTRRVQLIHAECDFDTQEYDSDMHEHHFFTHV